MLLGDHGAAEGQAAAAGPIDQLPGLLARRIGEGAAAGAAADRLGRLARRLDLGQPRQDRIGRAQAAGKLGAGEDPILRHAGMAIGEAEIALGQAMQLALAIHRLGRGDDIDQLMAIGAGVHAQRPADGAGNAGEEFETGDARLGRRAGDVEVEGRRTGADMPRPDADLGEAAAEPQHDARDAAVAHQQIGADADDGDRHIGGQTAEEMLQILQIGGPEHDLGRSADAKPGDAGERRLAVSRPRTWGRRSISGRGRISAMIIVPPLPPRPATHGARRRARRAGHAPIG